MLCLYSILDVDLRCNERGDVRLTHSDSDTKGRLEVCYDGFWGSVCEDDDDIIAVVVCRQLGYFSGQRIHMKDHTFFLVTLMPLFIQAGRSVFRIMEYLLYLLY